VDDSWRWSVAPDKGYTVSGVYHMLTAQKSIANIVTNDTIWNKSVSLKVSCFAWWLLRNKIQRRVVQYNSSMCVTGCSSLESIHHLFMRYDLFWIYFGVNQAMDTLLKIRHFQMEFQTVFGRNLQKNPTDFGRKSVFGRNSER